MPLQFHIYISCCDETCTELAMTVALNRYGHTVAIINFLWILSLSQIMKSMVFNYFSNTCTYFASFTLSGLPSSANRRLGCFGGGLLKWSY